MGVKVRKYKGKWYVFIDFNGRRKAKNVGTRQAAEEVRREIEARLALGDLSCLDKAPRVPTLNRTQKNGYRPTHWQRASSRR